MGNTAYRYFIAVKPPAMKAVGGDAGLHAIPQVIELTTVQVESETATVRVKDASAFNYIAYGVWATRPDAKKPETELGAGYLIAMPDGMTPVANMPVTGSATFEGQYTSYVRSKGAAQRITAMDGDVEMSANFGRGSVSVKLLDQFGSTNPLTLTGTIDGSTFSGTGLKDFGGSMLTTDGATANLEGAFYGMKVDEAGGVYDVLGGAKTNPGRVVGAFGGVNTGN